MKLHASTHCLDVTHSVLSGSKFNDVNFSGSTFTNVNMSGWTLEDVNLSGLRIHNANLTGVRIDYVNLAGSSIMSTMIDGMTINGILVTELMKAYAAQNPPADAALPAATDAAETEVSENKSKATP